MSLTSLLIELKNSIVLVPLVMLITVLIVFIKNKLTPKKEDQTDYISPLIISGLVGSFVFYIQNLKHYRNEIISTEPPPF